MSDDKYDKLVFKAKERYSHGWADPMFPHMEPKPKYVKIRGLDGMWMVSTSLLLSDVIKSGLTEEEADAWIRLLKEDG